MKKRILCFGDSNTWGYNALTTERYPENIRWPSVLQTRLGEEYTILEEALPGRTTVFDDPFKEGLNGLKYFVPCLRSHTKIDALVIMLGTNDCKERFSVTPQNITMGLKLLIEKALQMKEIWVANPEIFVLAPAPIRIECESTLAGGDMGKCSEKSYALARLYKEAAHLYGCHFFDIAACTSVSTHDYMHLDEESHLRLAEEMEKRIRAVFEKKEYI